MEDNNYRLIIDYFEKTISDDGLTKLQDWIEESPENLAQFSETIQVLEAARNYLKQPTDVQKGWEKVSARITHDPVAVKTKTLKVSWLAYAASFVAVCAVGWLGYSAVFPVTGTTASLTTISNPNGKRSKLTLPDSSVVYLGGGSTIRYPKKFTGSKRDVYLNGEAYFEVLHKTDKPFVVNSGHIHTVVLGTSFNVTAYSNDPKVTVTVNTGKVGVMADKQGNNHLIKHLLPNQQLSFSKQTGRWAFTTTNAANVISWTRNDLIFYNTSFSDIASRLEHHYGVKIDFTETRLGNVRLTTKLLNISLEQAMDNLTMLSGSAYTRNGNHLYILNKNQGGSKMR